MVDSGSLNWVADIVSLNQSVINMQVKRLEGVVDQDLFIAGCPK